MILDYEQKYKETLARARNMMSYKEVRREDMEYLFPELKESKDERIRKALISVLQSDFESDTTIHDISVGDIIAWLEKQGDANKIEFEQQQGDQKPTWSKDDENSLSDVLWCCKKAASIVRNENEMGTVWCAERWLKSLKSRL